MAMIGIVEVYVKRNCTIKTQNTERVRFQVTVMIRLLRANFESIWTVN